MDEYPWGVEEERKGRIARLTDRARKMIRFEAESFVSREAARMVTRQMLAEDAELMGFDPKTEVSAAVDEAITAAGSVP